MTLAATAATGALADPPPALFAGGMHGIAFAHDAHGNPHRGSPQLIDHGGPVLTLGADVTPIFWGSSWTNDTGGKFGAIDSFYVTREGKKVVEPREVASLTRRLLDAIGALEGAA